MMLFGIERTEKGTGATLFHGLTDARSSCSKHRGQSSVSGFLPPVRASSDIPKYFSEGAPLARENQHTSSVEAAINRGYYAVFQAARAALLTEEESPKTHSGVIQRFSYHFVRTGQVSEETGDIWSWHPEGVLSSTFRWKWA